MGRFIYNHWGALLAMTSACYAIWAGIWAIMYKKYFWDMVGATMGPAGLVPPPQAKFFLSIIVDVPLVQVINIINGLFTLALEWPLPILKYTGVYRSFHLRVAFYLWSGVLALFPYQTVDAGLFYIISSAVYCIAISRGELMESAALNRGKLSPV